MNTSAAAAIETETEEAIPGVIHIWLADDKTLCLLRSGDFRTELSELEQTPVAVCSTCLVLAGRIRRQACALLEVAEDQVFPERPTQAWEALRPTPWGKRVDLDTFLSHPGLDEQIKFGAIAHQIDPQSVQDLVSEITTARARLSDRRRRAQHERDRSL